MPTDHDVPPLLQVTHLAKVFEHRRLFWRKQQTVTAIERVDLTVSAGQTLGVVGMSGSGKSTLALCIAGLETPTSGTVEFEGTDIRTKVGRELRAFRQNVQLVLQDSASALNPRFTAMEIVTEPLLICGIGGKAERHEKALDMMRQLELPPSIESRRPRQMSGGQRQRLAIARALTLRPKLLILDEVLTGLDVPVQREFLSLLSRLRSQYAFTTLFISHDLLLMRALADRIAVMHSGRIVEERAPMALFADPQHEHTRALLKAIPRNMMRQPSSAGGD